MPASRAGSSRAGSVRDRSVSPIRSHRRMPTANDFPIPGEHTPFAVKVRDQGLVSPAASSFSFPDNEPPPIHAISTPPSPTLSLAHAVSTPRNDLEKDIMVHSITRGATEDSLPTSTPTRTPHERDVARKKSMYYQEVFAYRESNLTPKERIHNDSVITVEVKTNVIIRDEYLFLDELSQHLSQRYQRPTSSIFITLDHSACLLFAGTFDSAYVLTISALPSQLLPTTNKRNTALIQSHMASSLGVLPDRGVIRFFAIADEYLATKGTTYFGHIERLQKNAPDLPVKAIEPPKTADPASLGPQPVIPRLTIDKNKKNRQSLSIQTKPQTAPTPKRAFQSTPGSRVQSPTLERNPPIPSIPWDKNPMDRRAEKVQKLGKRRSFLTIFGRRPEARELS